MKAAKATTFALIVAAGCVLGCESAQDERTVERSITIGEAIDHRLKDIAAGAGFDLQNPSVTYVGFYFLSSTEGATHLLIADAVVYDAHQKVRIFALVWTVFDPVENYEVIHFRIAADGYHLNPL